MQVCRLAINLNNDYTERMDIEFNMYRARMFLFKQLKCSIILSGPVFFFFSFKTIIFAATYLANCLIKLHIYFTEIRSSVTDFREENEMDVCCLFKSLVSWWAALVFL